MEPKWLDQTLINESGALVSVRSLFEAANHVLFVFYPGDFTAVCTAQLCSYRDRFPDISKFNISIVGISNDSTEKHKEFRTTYNFPFPLYTDPKHAFAKALGATSKWLLGAATRGNVLAGKNGEILMKHLDAVPVTHQRVGTLLDELTSLKQKGLL